MEYVLNILVALSVLLIGAIGAETGALRAMLRAFATLLAVLVSVRYWEVGTKLTMGLIPMAGVAAPLWFIVIFVACLLLGLQLADWIAVKARYELLPVIDQVFGFCFGVLGGMLLACSILLAVSVPLIKWTNYDPTRARYRLEKCPLYVYRSLHEWTTGQPVAKAENLFPERVLWREQPLQMPEIRIKSPPTPDLPPE
jgi:Colicin V production protein